MPLTGVCKSHPTDGIIANRAMFFWMIMSAPKPFTLSLMSDLHLDFSRYAPGQVKADVHVLNGDLGEVKNVNPVLWALHHFPDPTQPVLFVPGNHDFYGGRMPDTLKLWRKTAKNTHVHVLYNDTFDFRGTRFVGTPLWSDLASGGVTQQADLMKTGKNKISDFSCIFNGQGKNWTVADMFRENALAIEFLERELVNDPEVPKIVLTHWAPHIGSTHPRFYGDEMNPYFINHLPHLVEQAVLWLHGHTHQPSDYRVGPSDARGRVIGHPRGYPHEQLAPYQPLILSIHPKTGVVRRKRLAP
jgi:predicted phosphodiesterase